MSKPKIPDCVKVDDCDREWLEQWQWYIDNGYCRRKRIRSDGPGSSRLHMHREIMQRMLGRVIDSKEQVDHADRDRSNNSRSNLRIVTHQQNQWNRTGARGYSWNKQCQKWQAYIRINLHLIHLGLFDTKTEAREAHLVAKAKYHVMP